MPAIRTIVIAVIRRPTDGALLVMDCADPSTRQRFFRPLGGGIEFGERSEDAVRRELREELGAEIADVRQLGVIENLFVLGGRPRHEIVIVVEATLVDESLYTFEELTFDEDGTPGTALWVRAEEWRSAARPDAPPLYPDGLSALLH